MEEIIIGILVFVAGIYLSRFIFRIDTIVTNLEEQTKFNRAQAKLLAHMAEKQGISESVINSCFKDPKEAYLEKMKEEKFGKLNETSKS